MYTFIIQIYRPRFFEGLCYADKSFTNIKKVYLFWVKVNFLDSVNIGEKHTSLIFKSDARFNLTGRVGSKQWHISIPATYH